MLNYLREDVIVPRYQQWTFYVFVVMGAIGFILDILIWLLK